MEYGIIAGFFIGFFRRMTAYYENSLTARVLRAFGRFMTNAFKYSLIGRFFTWVGKTGPAWENSLLFRALDAVLRFPVYLLERLAKFAEPALKTSFFARLIEGSEFLSSKMILYVVILIIPVTPLNTYLILLIGAACAVFMAESALKRERGFQLKNLDAAIIVFAFFVVLSCAGSNRLDESVAVLPLYVGALALVLLIVSSIRTLRDLNGIMMAFLLSSVVPCAYGIYQSIIGVPIDTEFVDIATNQGMPGRIFSTMANSNNFAEFLVMVIPAGVVLLFNAENIFPRKWVNVGRAAVALLLVPPVVCLALTYARGAYIAIAVGLFVFIALKNWRFIPVFLVLGIVSFFFLPQSITNRIMTIVNLSDTSSSYRLLIWKGVIKMLQEFWMTGLGLGTGPFSDIYLKYMPYGVSRATHCHNLFFEVWMEMGIMGILTFLMLYLRLMVQSIKAAFDRLRDKNVVNVVIGAFSSMVAILLVGSFEYVWFYAKVMMGFFAMTGVLMAALKLSEQPAESK